jgi:hypothetical protein
MLRYRALMSASYGVHNIKLYKRAAAYVDRILKGEGLPPFGWSEDRNIRGRFCSRQTGSYPASGYDISGTV